MSKAFAGGHANLPQAVVTSTGPGGLIGRELAGHEEFLAANELYGRVFGYREPDFSLNPNLLCALGRNGGSIVGVFAPDDGLVGFAYGFPGRDSIGQEYHYSQSAVVAAEYQGKGVGRQLKHLQRCIARRHGSESMRWTFDPALTRNGHFNFSTLGAIGTEYKRDYYCRPDTDRLIVEWALDQRTDPYAVARGLAAPRFDEADWGQQFTIDGVAWLPLPADPALTSELALAPKIADSIEAILADGMVVVNCRRINDTTAVYHAVPQANDIQTSATGQPHQEDE